MNFKPKHNCKMIHVFFYCVTVNSILSGGLLTGSRRGESSDIKISPRDPLSVVWLLCCVTTVCAPYTAPRFAGTVPQTHGDLVTIQPTGDFLSRARTFPVLFVSRPLPDGLHD